MTIVEFGDYDCPYCRQDEPTVKKVLAAYPTQVKLVFKELPLDSHGQAKQKAVVAECMGVQGRFWQAHDELFAGAPPKKATEGADQAKLKAAFREAVKGRWTTISRSPNG